MASTAASPADLNLFVLDVGEETGEPSTLGAFRDGKKLVLDFWHTRCTNCPNALTKLDGVAAKHPEVRFAACALSLGSKTEGTQEQVLELLDGMWENLTHLYMPFEDKEKAKELLGFKAVPFCVVFAEDGSILFKGDPGAVDFDTVFTAAAAVDEVAGGLEKASIGKAAAAEKPPVKPLAEANRTLGFGGDDDDF